MGSKAFTIISWVALIALVALDIGDLYFRPHDIWYNLFWISVTVAFAFTLIKRKPTNPAR
jgi:hypothetical protein